MPTLIGPGYTNNRIQKTFTTSITDILTVPVDKSVQIYKATICNKTNRDDITFDIMVWSGDNNEYYYIFKDYPIKNGMTYELWGVNLKHGDVLRCKSNVAESIDFLASYHLFNLSPLAMSVLKSYRESVGMKLTDTETLFYTEDLDKVSDFHDTFLCNMSDDDNVFVDLIFEDSSNNRSYILKDNKITSKDYRIIENFVTNAGDKLYVNCNKPDLVTIFANKLTTILN